MRAGLWWGHRPRVGVGWGLGAGGGGRLQSPDPMGPGAERGGAGARPEVGRVRKRAKRARAAERPFVGWGVYALSSWSLLSVRGGAFGFSLGGFARRGGGCGLALLRGMRQGRPQREGRSCVGERAPVPSQSLAGTLHGECGFGMEASLQGGQGKTGVGGPAAPRLFLQ